MTALLPVLVVMVGAPGAGKSHLAGQLARTLDFKVVENDLIRSTRYNPPSYSAVETATVRRLAAETIRRHLAAGCSVIYVGTNLTEEWRMTLSAEFGTVADLVFLFVWAPEDAELATMRRRDADGEGGPTAAGESWLSVYRRIALSMEPLNSPCVVVNARGNIGPVVRLLSRLAEGAGGPRLVERAH